MQQEKISRVGCSWTNPLNVLQEVIYYSFIKFCIYCFSLWYEFFVHYMVQQFNFQNGPVKENLFTCALTAAVAFEILSL
jgi:hypothetical protein